MSVEEIFSSKGRVKILKVLAEKEELNISAITRKTGLNHATTCAHLKKLCEMGIVEEKRFGRIRIFRLKKEYAKAQAIKNLFNSFKR
ncbi:MAG: ArsR family transcriptional regulator [Candidatus Methanomethylicia archaeon]|jgi:DNA-binding transcriptional ArsR family regulator|uniref:ArsR family transcriptional regulator n=1 Tax=Thermoproteota archaeon TaxID=2056631 RepID=A0A523BE63_9CREN|nr:ArsR family transcriptional regulator [Candidatus Methanomethylicia archaeon]MCQ5340430.1 ArsR family transcriptional regulator [Candidatus Methanomethylicia archaeon]NHV45044.1 winged helix-turn-helix transcriptional regulator [Candidatus Verstraetearchaeota archaeon]RZN56951.1 MAG: ArsR family transcriptional regulator [Candidatus Verstraetearchaeota archaeon]TDA39231.1 MAG: ArsR family transcriptional regulator [Candidatus Verstraetearchaeota archaeon]